MDRANSRALPRLPALRPAPTQVTTEELDQFHLDGVHDQLLAVAAAVNSAIDAYHKVDPMGPPLLKTIEDNIDAATEAVRSGAAKAVCTKSLQAFMVQTWGHWIQC